MTKANSQHWQLSLFGTRFIFQAVCAA